MSVGVTVKVQLLAVSETKATFLVSCEQECGQMTLDRVSGSVSVDEASDLSVPNQGRASYKIRKDWRDGVAPRDTWHIS